MLVHFLHNNSKLHYYVVNVFTLELIQNPAQSSDLASSVQDNNGVYFISAFGGLGVPINDEKAAAGFIGIKPTTNRVYLVRAALESIVFRIALCYELLNKQRQRNYKHIVYHDFNTILKT